MALRVSARALALSGWIMLVIAPMTSGVSLAHAASEADVHRARTEFTRGTSLVRRAQWAEALAAFERSQSLRPHAVTTFNIGACLRAMGRYTRARAAFSQALAENKLRKGELPGTLAAEARGYIAEIDRLAARVRVTIDPADAAIAIDGQPLVQDDSANTKDGVRMIAGLAPPGPGKPAPSREFEVIMDPGTHVLMVSRRGFAGAVVNRTFPPGTSEVVSIQLDRLPAVLRISSNEPSAVVTLDGLDLGTAPLEVRRPPGEHRLEVQKSGFATYTSSVTVRPGETVSLRAELEPASEPITKRWWFWTAAGVVVAGVAAGTYYATRPEPTQPPLN